MLSSFSFLTVLGFIANAGMPPFLGVFREIFSIGVVYSVFPFVRVFFFFYFLITLYYCIVIVRAIVVGVEGFFFSKIRNLYGFPVFFIRVFIVLLL